MILGRIIHLICLDKILTGVKKCRAKTFYPSEEKVMCFMDILNEIRHILKAAQIYKHFQSLLCPTIVL